MYGYVDSSIEFRGLNGLGNTTRDPLQVFCLNRSSLFEHNTYIKNSKVLTVRLCRHRKLSNNFKVNKKRMDEITEKEDIRLFPFC